MTQLERLAQPLPAKFVKDNPSGYGTYVSHGVVTQRLLEIVGPYGQEVVEVIRGEYEHKVKKGATQQYEAVEMRTGIVGVILALTLTIDGRYVRVEEAGDCEQPDNWPHDGARLKDAISDAHKRCAMREGLGLWLWSQKDIYFLHEHLTRDKSGAASPPQEGGVNGSEGAAPITETQGDK